jgi:lysophosphatidate acyltransferase
MILLFLGPFGIGSWLCGLIFINKGSADSGKQKMNEAMEKLKKEKTKLLVFPEGYRNHSGKIVEFKKGAFHLAIQSQVPIIPVVLSSYKGFMRKSEKVFDSGEVLIEVLPKIPTVGMTSKDVNKLMENVREIMIKKYDELNEEVEKNNKVK